MIIIEYSEVALIRPPSRTTTSGVNSKCYKSGPI